MIFSLAVFSVELTAHTLCEPAVRGETTHPTIPIDWNDRLMAYQRQGLAQIQIFEWGPTFVIFPTPQTFTALQNGGGVQSLDDEIAVALQEIGQTSARAFSPGGVVEAASEARKGTVFVMLPDDPSKLLLNSWRKPQDPSTKGVLVKVIRADARIAWWASEERFRGKVRALVGYWDSGNNGSSNQTQTLQHIQGTLLGLCDGGQQAVGRFLCVQIPPVGSWSFFKQPEIVRIPLTSVAYVLQQGPRSWYFGSKEPR